MADIGSRVIRRSAGLFRDAAAHGGGGAGCAGYGVQFGYRERALARDEGVARTMATPTPPAATRQRLIDRGRLPAPGQGPSADVRAKSWFRLLLLASADEEWESEAAGARRVLTSVRGRDPGYDETSKCGGGRFRELMVHSSHAATCTDCRAGHCVHRMVAEAAVLLATRRDELPRLRRSGGGVGGVVTPAFAFGSTLRDALHMRGVEFREHELREAAGLEGVRAAFAAAAAEPPPPPIDL